MVLSANPGPPGKMSVTMVCGVFAHGYVDACMCVYVVLIDRRIRVYDTSRDGFNEICCIQAQDVGWSILDLALRYLCPSVCLSVCLPLCVKCVLSFSLCLCLPVCMFVCVCISVICSLSIHCLNRCFNLHSCCQIDCFVHCTEPNK